MHAWLLAISGVARARNLVPLLHFMHSGRAARLFTVAMRACRALLKSSIVFYTESTDSLLGKNYIITCTPLDLHAIL